jgi:hypothetical protein
MMNTATISAADVEILVHSFNHLILSSPVNLNLAAPMFCEIDGPAMTDTEIITLAHNNGHMSGMIVGALSDGDDAQWRYASIMPTGTGYTVEPADAMTQVQPRDAKTPQEAAETAFNIIVELATI